VYVGSSKRIPRRWKEHKRELRKGVHDNTKLQNAWNKYGESVFEFEVIAYCREPDLLWQEQIALDALDSVNRGYNVASKADKPPSNKGVKRSSEHSEHLSQALMGKNLSESHKESLRRGWVSRKEKGWGRHTEEFKSAVGDRFRGKKQSAEWIEKRTSKLRGHTISDEQKAQISKTLKGRPNPKGSANLTKASNLRTPEYKSWIGRKGSASKWGKEFSEPKPLQCYYKEQLSDSIIESAAFDAAQEE
jgi:group I intron endonuclease